MTGPAKPPVNLRPTAALSPSASAGRPDAAASRGALLAAIHARLNRPRIDEAAVLTIVDEIEAEIPELAALRKLPRRP